MPKHPERKGFIYLFIFFISFYFLLSSGRFYCGDEVNVYLTTQALITKGELSIPPVCYPATKGLGDKYYSHKGLGLSLAAVPYYLAGAFLEKILPAKILTMLARQKPGDTRDFFFGDIKIFAVSQLDVHFTALLCCMFYLLLLRLGFSIKAAVLAALILGSSTLVCSYSKTFFDQALECFTLLAAVYFIFLKRTNLNLLLSGIFLGLSVLTRAENMIAVPFFACYIFVKEQGSLFNFKLNKGTVVKIIIFLAPVIAAVFFNRLINFLKFGPVIQYGFPGLPGGLSYLFSESFLTGLYGHFFSAGKSIFIFSPPLLIAMFYLKEFFLGHKTEAVFLYAVSVSFIAVYSKYFAWNGGWCWGDRYLYVIIPLLLLPLGYFIEKLFVRKRAWQIIVLGSFILAGIFVQVLGTATYMFDLNEDPEWANVIDNPYSIDIYSMTIFIPKISPVVFHWKALSAGKYIDYWFYHICKNYGLGWMLFFLLFPLLGLALSARGLLEIAGIPCKVGNYKTS